MSDLTALNALLPLPEKCPGPITTRPAVLEWLQRLTKAQLKLALTCSSTAERDYKPKFGPHLDVSFTCACGKTFPTAAQLGTHRYSAHKQRHPWREAVLDPRCPMCMQDFSSLKTAQAHFQKVCAPRAEASLLAGVLRAQQQERARREQASTKSHKLPTSHTATNQHTLFSSFHKARSQ